jgi:hypothetical protein
MKTLSVFLTCALLFAVSLLAVEMKRAEALPLDRVEKAKASQLRSTRAAVPRQPGNAQHFSREN